MRVLIAAVIGSAAISGVSGWLMRGKVAQAEIAQIHADALKAQNAAQAEILSRERANHDRLAKAAQNADKRAREASAVAAAAADDLRLLNGAADAAIADAQSSAAADSLRAGLFRELLGACAREYLIVAGEADRADRSVQTLIESWPR